MRLPFLISVTLTLMSNAVKRVLALTLFVYGATAAAQESQSLATAARLEPVVVNGRVADRVWLPYRETYAAMLEYRSVVRLGDPVEPLLWLKPVKGSPDINDVRLRLVGPTVDQSVEIRHYWGAIPFNSAAADEEADFVANFPAGSFSMVRLIGIKRLESGFYTPEYLQSSCDRALELLKSIDWAYKIKYAFKKCTGVRFYMEVDGASTAPEVDDLLSPEPSDAPLQYSVYSIRFLDAPLPRSVHLARMPIAIRPIYER